MSSFVTTNLLNERRTLWDSGKALLDKAANEGRDLTTAEDAEFRQMSDRIDEIDQRLIQMKEDEQRSQASANAFSNLLAQPVVGETRKADCWLPGTHEYRKLQDEQRAVGTTGAFIPVAAAGTYFDLLRARVGVLAAGPVILPVDHAGSIDVPKVTSAVTISPLAENTAITPGDPGLGKITLDPKKFAAMTLVAREAVEDSKPELRQVVANSLIRDMAVKLDQQFVNGSGSGGQLTGLLGVSGVTAGPSLGTNGAALTFAFLADTLAAYDGANADPDRAAWIMHSRTWSSVRKLQDDQHRPIVSIDPTANVRPTLWGRPVYISNSLPINQTVGTSIDCSSIILADMSQVVVAQARQVELLMSEHFAFDKDQIALRVTARFDIGVPQPTAVTITTGVRP